MPLERRALAAVYAPERLVYLTADSPHVLHTLADEDVYVIGGLVDRNRHKGLCLQRATAMGVRHAQLPIAEAVAMSTRRILAVNHGTPSVPTLGGGGRCTRPRCLCYSLTHTAVFEVLLRYRESGDWPAAIAAVLPQRKDFTLRPNAATAVANPEAETPHEVDDTDQPTKRGRVL
jgi:tRNA (guanine9-N1)-methyltransferase